MNNENPVADLSTVLPGELFDVDPEDMLTDDEVLASDLEFEAHLDARLADALAYQMEHEEEEDAGDFLF